MVNFDAFINPVKAELIELSDTLYANPELSGKEYRSKDLHCALLKRHLFEISEIGHPELETGFIACYDTHKPGLNVAFLAEYDALPSIGHGCGHNILGAASTGAAILLSKIADQTGGKVYLMGTPAEETYGGKIPMIEAGCFKDISIAMMAHPECISKVSGESLANHAVMVTFRGKSAHAAACPESGINALSAMMLTYMGINAMREHFTDDVRVHGIITDGGDAPNVVPEFVRGKFYIRALKKTTANAAKQKFLDIVKGAELMTGAKSETEAYEYSFDDMNTNRVLSDVCVESMEEAGIGDISRDTEFKASIDMGNVSYCVPAIHVYFSIVSGKRIAMHTREFANETITDFAHGQMYKMASALALTGYKIMKDPALYKKIQKEFESTTISKGSR